MARLASSHGLRLPRKVLVLRSLRQTPLDRGDVRTSHVALLAALCAGSSPSLADSRRDALEQTLEGVAREGHVPIAREQIGEAVSAALDLERPGLSAELLLSLCWFESNLNPHSRPQSGVMQVTLGDLDAHSRWWLRELAVLPMDRPPRSSDLQTSQYSGIAAGVAEIDQHRRELRVEWKDIAQRLPSILERRACGGDRDCIRTSARPFLVLVRRFEARLLSSSY